MFDHERNNKKSESSPNEKDKQSPLSIEKCRSHPSPILLNQHGSTSMYKKNFSSTPKAPKQSGVKFNIDDEPVATYFDVSQNQHPKKYERRSSFNKPKAYPEKNSHHHKPSQQHNNKQFNQHRKQSNEYHHFSKPHFQQQNKPINNGPQQNYPNV